MPGVRKLLEIGKPTMFNRSTMALHDRDNGHWKIGLVRHVKEVWFTEADRFNKDLIHMKLKGDLIKHISPYLVMEVEVDNLFNTVIRVHHSNDYGDIVAFSSCKGDNVPADTQFIVTVFKPNGLYLDDRGFTYGFLPIKLIDLYVMVIRLHESICSKTSSFVVKRKNSAKIVSYVNNKG